MGSGSVLSYSSFCFSILYEPKGWGSDAMKSAFLVIFARLR